MNSHGVNSIYIIKGQPQSLTNCNHFGSAYLSCEWTFLIVIKWLGPFINQFVLTSNTNHLYSQGISKTWPKNTLLLHHKPDYSEYNAIVHRICIFPENLQKVLSGWLQTLNYAMQTRQWCLYEWRCDLNTFHYLPIQHSVRHRIHGEQTAFH